MLEQIRSELAPAGTTLVAVSKTKPVEQIRQLYDAGHRQFGENRAPEMAEKYEQLPKDIEWHFIGHLQRNKVKLIAPFVHLVHSVDSYRLLREINKEAAKNDRTIDCLLQFKIAAEDTKYGFDPATVRQMLSDPAFAELKNIRLLGVMGMATFTDNEAQVRSEFRKLRAIFSELKDTFFPEADHFREISMGMSNDYLIALSEGSTMVRIGSLIFGPRD